MFAILFSFKLQNNPCGLPEPQHFLRQAPTPETNFFEK
jgi:hypothetical protein